MHNLIYCILHLRSMLFRKNIITYTIINASDTSSYCILAVEFLMKMYTCYGIIKIDSCLKSAYGQEKDILIQRRQLEMKYLSLNAFVTVIMPIVYVTLVLVVYYGPNAAILGNIGCDKWMWKKIPNMAKFLTALFRMFIITLGALFTTGLFLWKFSSINIFKQLCHDVHTHWAFISVVIGGAISKVSISEY